jgi:RNA recognition motif-containing protein
MDKHHWKNNKFPGNNINNFNYPYNNFMYTRMPTNYPQYPNNTYPNSLNQHQTNFGMNPSLNTTNIQSQNIPFPQNTNTSSFHFFIPWKRAQNDPSLVKRGTEIHINPLPIEIKHEELYNIFKLYGEIIDLRIIPRKDKGNCFAFIRYMEISSVDKVMLESIVIQGHQVNISKSKEETTIFIGNIRKNWTKSFLENLLRERVPDFDELRFFQDPSNPSRNRGYCFIKFENPMIAREAYDKLSKNILIEGSPVTIDWADDFSENDVSKVQIHLSGITDSVSTEDLYKVFEQYGQIINIKLSRDLEGKQRKDYGFITYSNEEEASLAMKKYNWKDYFESPINIQYARKMVSVFKHREKVKGDMLERKRRRDNLLKYQKKHKSSVSDSDEDNEEKEQTIKTKDPKEFMNVLYFLIC